MARTRLGSGCPHDWDNAAASKVAADPGDVFGFAGEHGAEPSPPSTLRTAGSRLAAIFL